MGKKQRKRELKRLWRYTESLNAWFESALNRCEDLVGALEKTHGVGTCSQYGPGVGSDSVAKLGDAVQPEEPICIFSGDYSGKMWDAINNARTKEDLRGALYFVCCRLQEFESLNEHDHQVIRERLDALEHRQRMDDAELAATVPPDSRSVLGYHGPDDDLDEPLPRMPLENSMVDMTFKVVGQGQPLSVLGCGPNEIGLATEEFLETVPQC